MVSSDFGKLEVSLHLISGVDCAIAGLATALAAATSPAARRNWRRFIKSLPQVSANRLALRCRPGMSGAATHHDRVRVRIMKASYENSATCHQRYSSLRNACIESNTFL